MVLTLTFPGSGTGGALPDQDRYTIELSTNIEDSDGQNLAGDRDLDTGALETEVNGDRAGDPLDSGGILARFGSPVELNGQYDINTDGGIDQLDVGFVLSRIGECD